MNLERYVPTDWLKPFVQAFLIIESDDGIANRVLPDTSMVIAFRYKGLVSDTQGQRNPLPSSALTGLQPSSRLLTYANHTATLLVLFREGRAAAFFREPLHELFGVSLPLDTLMPTRELAGIEDRLAGTNDNRERISIVEQFLRSKLKWPSPDPLLVHAVATIQAGRGSTVIHQLAQSLGISQDAFEKRFRRSVGTTPKQFARIVRFRHLIRTHTPGQHLTDLAYEGNYFDQAHFINDFRSFTRQTPQDFFQSDSYW
ncbi:AraC family transcriptional regulator [Spirosoma arcticum]